MGSGDSSVVKLLIRDGKVAGSSTDRSSGRIFFSRINFLYWLLFRYPFHPRVTAVARKKINKKKSLSFCQKCKFGIRSTPVLPQWHVKKNKKNPCHSAKSASGRLHQNSNTHAPYICGFAWIGVPWCKVVWCTQNVRQDGCSLMWHQPCNNHTALW